MKARLLEEEPPESVQRLIRAGFLCGYPQSTVDDGLGDGQQVASCLLSLPVGLAFVILFALLCHCFVTLFWHCLGVVLALIRDWSATALHSFALSSSGILCHFCRRCHALLLSLVSGLFFTPVCFAVRTSSQLMFTTRLGMCGACCWRRGNSVKLYSTVVEILSKPTRYSDSFLCLLHSSSLCLLNFC